MINYSTYGRASFATVQKRMTNVQNSDSEKNIYFSEEERLFLRIAILYVRYSFLHGRTVSQIDGMTGKNYDLGNRSFVQRMSCVQINVG